MTRDVKSHRLMGSPAILAATGPSIWLGLSGFMVLASIGHAQATLWREVFDFCILSSPIVSLLCAAGAGIINYACTHNVFRRICLLIVAVVGFSVGFTVSKTWNLFVGLYVSSLNLFPVYADYIDFEVACYAGIVGALVFLLQAVIIWLYWKIFRKE